MKNVFIYCLKSPDGEIKYVGKTKNIKRRLSAHLYEANGKSKRHVLNWIRSLKAQGLRPTIEVIEECSVDVWQEREKYWISYYREHTDKLCNLCDGGLGGTGHSPIYSDKERKRRSEKMRELGNTRSKLSKEEKIAIWTLIEEGKSRKEIQLLYPNFTQPIHFAVTNGRTWNHITGLPRTTPSKRTCKGYIYNQGLYIVRSEDKKKRIFSSKNEEEVKEYLKNNRQ